MTFQISTQVEASMQEVFDGFTKDLFLELAPPFPPVRLLRFDGSRPGDLVQLELNFLLFRQRWTSRIVEADSGADAIWFVDEGIELPFFLKRWRHVHRVEATSEGGAVIRDEITYQTPGGKVMDGLLFPAMYLQFAYRKPIYRRFFRKQNPMTASVNG